MDVLNQLCMERRWKQNWCVTKPFASNSNVCMKIIGIEQNLMACVFRQGPLVLLQARPMTQKVQNNIVPWLLSRFGAAYKRDDGPNVVKEMIIALIKRDNMAGLADHIDLLKDRHALAMGHIAKKARITATKASIIIGKGSAPLSW